MIMAARDKLLIEKDRVQKRLWKESGKTGIEYVELIHKKALSLRETNSKRYTTAK